MNEFIKNEIDEQHEVITKQRTDGVKNGEKQKVDLKDKYFLTIPQAAEVFGIGIETMRKFAREHDGEDYMAYVGTRRLIKREKFEEYLNSGTIAFCTKQK